MERGSFFDKLISLIYPDTCPYCGKIIDSGKTKCNECEKDIKCIFSVRKILGEVVCVSPYRYSGRVRTAIRKFKFRRYKRYSWNFAMEIVKSIEARFPDKKFSAVTYVPLHKYRKNDRGYNQSRLLAAEIGRKLDIPVQEFLRKIKNNSPQHRLKNLKDRVQNVKGVYEAACRGENRDGTVILCDDIVTSGSTLVECVKMLKKAGFKDILCVTVANTVREVNENK